MGFVWNKNELTFCDSTLAQIFKIERNPFSFIQSKNIIIYVLKNSFCMQLNENAFEQI